MYLWTVNRVAISVSWDNLSPAVQKRNPHLKEVLGGISGPDKKAKYNNKRVMVDGIWFDSRKEAEKYQELNLLKQAGEVVSIELQPKYLLQDGYTDYQTKRWVRTIKYIADFKVTYADGREVVIDTKGFKTKEYQLKKKMFRSKYPDIEFIEE